MFCKLVGGIFVVVKVGNSCGRGEICKFIKGIGSCWRKGNFFNFNLCGEIFFLGINESVYFVLVVCVCCVFGDLYYKMYDGLKIYFMGVCKYMLIKMIEKILCVFNIMVLNER